MAAHMASWSEVSGGRKRRTSSVALARNGMTPVWERELSENFPPIPPCAARLLGKAMRFFVVVQGDEIIVNSATGFRATYFKRPYHPQLVLRRRTQTDDHELWRAPGRRPMR